MIGEIFNTFLIHPITNLFILLASVTGNAGIGVILLTLIIRVVTAPLTLKQMKSTRAMAAMSPRISEIQKRYKDPKRRSEEQMKLYKEAGLNPIGCFSSMLLQFPILIALFQVFRTAMGEAPESLIKLSERLYAWDYLRSAVPLNANFLWLHLGRPDPLILPILVAGTTYVLQKMTMLPATDERQKAQNSMMNLMMPLIFGWITITLPSGLGLYYVLSNLIGMFMQYAYVGGGAINLKAIVGLSQEPVLPKAVAARQAQIDSMKKVGRDSKDEDDDSDGAVTSSAEGAPSESAGRRRRRYTSGKRRGRR